MTKILYGVSPIGLGHAARAVAVGEELRRRGFDPIYASGRNAVEFIRSYGFVVEDVITEPVPKVVSGEMKSASTWYFRYWRGFRKSKKRMAALITAARPDLVVGDEEFSGLVAAKERGLRNVMITDELELGFARGWLARKIEARVESWYEALQSQVDLLIVPEAGTDSANRRYVGPIVRGVTRSKANVVDEFSLPKQGRMLLLSLSGAGLGDHLVRPLMRALARSGDDYLVITGNRGDTLAGDRVYDLGVVRDNQNLVAAADLVISTAGKSTIDEATGAGTPIIVVPMRNHAEQERNAAALGFKPDDIGRLSELIQERLGRRGAPRSFDGARKTADLLVGVAAYRS
ncbi:MAG: hypothetical protein LYZ69_00100 [Nitrososphaerales archaeon]|nr:hypothetical protein [Nitrososphaerales archaeon]